METLPQSSRSKPLKCLFCWKEVGNGKDRKRECTDSMFRSCFKHLPGYILLEKNFEKFKNNNGPFCTPCFQSAQQLAVKMELLETVEKEIDNFVNCLIASILGNRNASSNTPFEYLSNIDIQIHHTPNYTIEIQEESGSPVGVFDCFYEEEVEAIQAAEQHLRDSFAVVEPEKEVGRKKRQGGKNKNLKNSSSAGANITLDVKKSPVFPETTPSVNQMVLTDIVLQKSPSGKVSVAISCECGMSFDSEKKMSEHSLSCSQANSMNIDALKEKDVRYRCGICGFLTKTVDELAEHKTRHVKKYVCKKCGEKFSMKVQLDKHLLAHRIHKCATCNKGYRNKETLIAHEKKMQCVPTKKKSKERQCEMCGKICGSKTNLNYHIATTHSDPVLYECSICHKKVKSRYILQTHQQTHLKVKDYLCAEEGCGKSFVDVSLLNKHRKLHSDDSFKCEICGYRTLIQKKLEIHKNREHDPSKKFECNNCGKRVSTLFALQTHEKIHTGEKPHECKICGETFRTSTVLKIHTNRKHTEGKFKCPSCGYMAGSQYLLNHHSKVHSDNKPFSCGACGQGFKVKSSMIKHERLTCKVANNKS